MTNQVKFYFICFIAFITFWEVKAQHVISFTNGLIAGPCHQYGREAIYTDQLAFQLYKGALNSPKAGQILFTDEKVQPVTWQKINADPSGLFKTNDLSNKYIYLTYTSDKEDIMLLKAAGNSMFYFNGEPHAGDIYSSNWLYIPVKVKKGLNEIYLRSSRNFEDGISVNLIAPEKPVMLNTEDLTLPFIIKGENNESLMGALLIINSTTKPLTGLEIQTRIEGKDVKVTVPQISPLSFRKVGFRFNATNISQKGQYNCTVTLSQKGKSIDEKIIKVEAVDANEQYSNTFISDIDGSVQYFSVCPQKNKTNKAPALFLSVHGAGVEAIGQARAYQPKDWGILVTPTNRRPRGFNWEDWGRLDALEVLGIATKKFNPDPERIYLTGHSMGGHGTWYLGATFPGKWAAIAPCAGYPTLTGYGSADGKIPATGRSSIENILLQASNGSNVFELAKNYNAGGVYIHHGDSDEVVSVNYARQMKKTLAEFHKDFCYYEYPGGGHWFGNQSVDWQPIFDYFKWHTIRPDSIVNKIDFTTANPAVSPSYYWASVLQQQEALKYSRLRLVRSKSINTISGETENVSILGISLAAFKPGETITLNIDQQSLKYVVPASTPMLYLYHKGQWQTGGQPDQSQKGIVRNGTFKEPFNYRMVFVYGTCGNVQENAWAIAKARFDAETWYYRANGAVDVVADKDFNPAQYPDRGVIIYGNATTNSAWKKLLTKCPVQVQRGSLTIGNKQLKGDDLGAYIMWPRSDSKKASIAAISGTGLSGFNATYANQYFAGGSGFPDYMIFSADMLKDGATGIKYAGFYNNDWTIPE
ncbi:MAG: prolyl oligopeptidase family serine peptidase [Bacteroidota bacterium]|nr:prolyl oligopeptidase family serine peptidase [Bacteroidota bacterium]